MAKKSKRSSTDRPSRPIRPADPLITMSAAGAAAALEPSTVADVVIDTQNGEFLHYRITVEGANPKFVFSSTERPKILEAKDFPGHPKASYEFDFLRNPADIDKPLDTFTIAMLFIAASKYHLAISHHRADGTDVVIKDRTFESDDPETIKFTAVVAQIL